MIERLRAWWRLEGDRARLDNYLRTINNCVHPSLDNARCMRVDHAHLDAVHAGYRFCAPARWDGWCWVGDVPPTRRQLAIHPVNQWRKPTQKERTTWV